MIRPKKHLNSINRDPAVPETRLNSLRLDKNEYLPAWPKEWVDEFLSQIRPEHLSTLPELDGLYKKIERVLKIPRDSFVVTAGTDLAIKAAFEVFVSPGDEVVFPSPTFAMYSVYSRIFDAKMVEVNYKKDLSLDIEEYLGAITSNTSLIAIANPNSPTGTKIEQEDLERIIRKGSEVGSAVLIDEAYHPFCKETMLDRIGWHDNLIVTRTFSKAAGIAGLRVGLAATNPKIAKLLFAVKPMYEVTTISIMLAEYVLDNYERVFRYAEEVGSAKIMLEKYFRSKGFEVRVGHANFIHIDFGGRKEKIVKYLQGNEVLFKEKFDHLSLTRFCRFSVGTMDYSKLFMSKFDGLGI